MAAHVTVALGRQIADMFMRYWRVTDNSDVITHHKDKRRVDTNKTRNVIYSSLFCQKQLQQKDNNK